jgi:hypothetical protein
MRRSVVSFPGCGDCAVNSTNRHVVRFCRRPPGADARQNTPQDRTGHKRYLPIDSRARKPFILYLKSHRSTNIELEPTIGSYLERRVLRHL